MTDKTSLQGENLRLRAELALTGAYGVNPAAAPDLARRLIEDHKLEAINGRLRCATGDDLASVVEKLRLECPAYFGSVAAKAAPQPEPQRTRRGPRPDASTRLSRANGDHGPRLNGGTE